MNLDFYKDKVVLITGHTGFKGSWMSKLLLMQGAKVVGYSLEAPTEPSLFSMAGLAEEMISIIGDIRDYEKLVQVFDTYQPEIVIHMAAQPIVREGYRAPRYTYETNVMGTVNICEAVRCHPCVKSFINVTTDKVYRDDGMDRGYIESDVLGGADPYANSKSCSELVTQSYLTSFFKEMEVAVSTCRAGNVVGGGDFAKDRIIPDCYRAVAAGERIKVRNPHSIRPYQHVLEAVSVYLKLAELQYLDKNTYAGHYNIGPDEGDYLTTGVLVDMFCKNWGEGASWDNCAEENAPYEAKILRLNTEKIKKTISWEPRWTIEETMEKIVSWYKCYQAGGDVAQEMASQIQAYLEDA